MFTKEQLETLLRDPEFRRQFVADYVQEMVSAQIRALREHHGWTQEELGDAAGGISQVQISRLENPDYSGTSLNSLKRLAQALDVALIVRPASFGEFVDWVTSMSPERLVPLSYIEEQDMIRSLADASYAISSNAPAESSVPMSYGELIEERDNRALAALSYSTTPGEQSLATAA